MAGNYEIKEYEVDLDELMNLMGDNIKKDVKSFEDLINLESSINREIYLGDIEDLINLEGSINKEIYLGDIEVGIGSTVEGYIRFWNKYDEKHNIPVEERKPIKIYVDSYGGSLTDCFTIIDSINLSKTPIITICTGCAYSAGFFIFINGGERIAYPRASFLFHKGATGSNGTASQFENYAQFYKKQLSQLKKVVLSNTKITEDEYESIRKDDIWFNAEEALERGIADKIAEEMI